MTFSSDRGVRYLAMWFGIMAAEDDEQGNPKAGGYG
jgi:hypothetical protein